MGFTDQLEAFSKKSKIRMDQVVRKVLVDMTADLVRLTPVDTGHARSNWFFGYEPPSTIDPTALQSGSPSFNRMNIFAAALRAGGVFYITNNVPYILRLEFGSSQQAPNGMARITVDRWQARVNKIVQSLTSDGGFG